MLALRVHPEADNEGLNAAAYIREDDPHQAELFKTALKDAIRWARTQPLIFRRFEKDFRKIKVGKFRYLLIFRIKRDEVQVLAIAHTSLPPGYWKNRAKQM